jgi:glycosyltransferase involved in cell wall biosynthesis
MKLIVQIPCFNEEHTLPQTVRDIPRWIDGVDKVEILVVDDGSMDRTVEVAKELGVDHIVRHRKNRGLAATFRTGIDAALQLGADIIVNTDGDNQYPGKEIPRLIAPVLARQASIVVGDRQTQTIRHFSATKKLLQRTGSAFVSRISGLDIPDVVSGFRAYSRDAALSLNVVSSFSYTVETIIQAGNRREAITHVPIETNTVTRPSRLFKSMGSFLTRQVTTIIRMYALYQPLRTFAMIGGVLLVLGLLPMIRFMILFAMGDGAGHLQSLVLGGVLVVLGVNTLILGLLADLLGWSRVLQETALEKIRRIELVVDAWPRRANDSGPIEYTPGRGHTHRQCVRQVSEPEPHRPQADRQFPRRVPPVLRSGRRHRRP